MSLFNICPSGNFNIGQNEKDKYYIKYDSGIHYYKGFIDPKYFNENIQLNYMEIVREAIDFFDVDIDKDKDKVDDNLPKITSYFEFTNNNISNFVINFQMNNINNIIKIKLEKFVKTFNEIRNDQEKIIIDLDNIILNQHKLIISQEQRIILLEKNVNELKNGLTNELKKELRKELKNELKNELKELKNEIKNELKKELKNELINELKNELKNITKK